jgi:hypothetical protein
MISASSEHKIANSKISTHSLQDEAFDTFAQTNARYTPSRHKQGTFLPTRRKDSGPSTMVTEAAAAAAMSEQN